MRAHPHLRQHNSSANGWSVRACEQAKRTEHANYTTIWLTEFVKLGEILQQQQQQRKRLRWKKTMHIKWEHFVMAMKKVEKSDNFFSSAEHFYTMKIQNDCWESARLLWCHSIWARWNARKLNERCMLILFFPCESHWPLTWTFTSHHKEPPLEMSQCKRGEK